MAAIEIDEVPVFKSGVPAQAVAVRGDMELADIVSAQSGERPEPLEWIDLKGFWIPSDEMHLLDGLGYESVPVEGAVAHLAYRIYERNLGTLFSNEIFLELLATMHNAEPAAMREIDEKIERPALHRLLRYLVEDGVPVRPLPLLIGSLHYWLHSLETPKVVTLAEYLRGSMKRQLCHRIAGREGILGIMLLDPSLEATIRRSMQDVRRSTGVPEDGLTLPPQVNEAILKQMRDVIAAQDSNTRLPAIVCAADLRRRLRNYLAMHDIHLPVLATHELASEISTYPLGLLNAPHHEVGNQARAAMAAEGSSDDRPKAQARRRANQKGGAVPA